MGKLSLKLLFFLPILLLVIAVNYFVDPANLYNASSLSGSNSYEQTIAQYIAAGYNVANVDALDERLFEKQLILLSKSDPELAILGSSRSQLIGNNIFPHYHVMNNSVTGATIEDLLALLNVYDSIHHMPSEVMIELSPWYLNSNNDQFRWKSLEKDYSAFVKKMSQEKNALVVESDVGRFSINPKLLELVSFEYFQQSIRTFVSRKNPLSEDMFDRAEFKDGYTIREFYHQVSAVKTPSGKPLISDTLAYLNDYLQKTTLFSDLKKIYPEQELPEEILFLHQETQQYRETEWPALSAFQKQNIVRLNRKLLEVFFYETCPPSETSMSYPTSKPENSGLTRKVDGTISYPHDFRNQSVTEVNYAAQSFLNTNVFGLNDFREISSKNLTLLENMVDYLLKKKVKVKFLLVPYHPAVYQVLSTKDKYKYVLEAEEVFNNLANKKMIQIQGSYNPDAMNLSELDFYDAMHPKEKAMEKILID